MSSTRLRFLLEAHYYDGGIQFQPFCHGARPEWCPPVEDGMLEAGTLTDAQDIAVCQRNVVHQGRRVTWTGLFVNASDRQFGDRGTHAGVGIWVDDGVVVDQHGMLTTLWQLADTVRKQARPATSLIDTVQTPGNVQAVSAMLGAWSDLVPLMKDWAFAPPGPCPKQVLSLPRSGNHEDVLRLMADALHAAQLGALTFDGASTRQQAARLVVMVSARTAPDAGYTNLLASRATMVPDLVRRLPAIVSELHATASQAGATLAGVVRERDSAIERARALDASLATATRELQDLRARPVVPVRPTVPVTHGGAYDRDLLAQNFHVTWGVSGLAALLAAAATAGFMWWFMLPEIRQALDRATSQVTQLEPKSVPQSTDPTPLPLDPVEPAEAVTPPPATPPNKPAAPQRPPRDAPGTKTSDPK